MFTQPINNNDDLIKNYINYIIESFREIFRAYNIDYMVFPNVHTPVASEFMIMLETMCNSDNQTKNLTHLFAIVEGFRFYMSGQGSKRLYPSMLDLIFENKLEKGGDDNSLAGIVYHYYYEKFFLSHIILKTVSSIRI